VFLKKDAKTLEAFETLSKFLLQNLEVSEKVLIFAGRKKYRIMNYAQMAQLELMNAAANITSQDDLDALRMTLSLFFAERAQKAIDKMWDEGTFDQSKLDELRGQHLRTPYDVR
jgi:hypothetical protein